MTIREVITMLTKIFNELIKFLTPLFDKSEGEDAEAEAPEATV